ncbi:glutamate-5-semialdehyde dehydrogenase [Candidatus Puniceispirillum marinum]|uniref:Gamma-glutamyl phosphate reductase n=1 Tax=Puniceispirillum marinum (strain IMCC1322) TaxID=488538 RepID=D5BMQ2_PUNMI|nr:glutamate-5-semialdehyde dehydrogenase [Candidatus Puniceispirillum marinum]ADE40095.1 gamma-glutamyl phosphate reductase [Candidatus Puniceispirillum marinum IMCC1322]
MTEQSHNFDSPKALVSDLVTAARRAQKTLGQSPYDARRSALLKSAELIRAHADAIITTNSKDVEKASENSISAAFIDRLTMNAERVEAMAAGLESIAALDDPIGRELARWQQPNGLDIARVATPLGIIGIIYESRPNVTVDAAALCLISGNAAILRGGSDSYFTSSMLAGLMVQGLESAGLPAANVQMIPSADRAIVGAMLAAAGEIDVIIPRGGRSLVERVQSEARVPVFAHLEGICHVYVDADADFDMAQQIIVNAKMRRTGICGAAETLLIHRDVATRMLPSIATALTDAGCALRGDALSCDLVDTMTKATEADWRTEYLDSILSVKIVDSVDDAIAHIGTYGSGHTESIVTGNADTAEHFLARVDSAIVMVNASTQFADGGEFGMGAEIGIATGRLHARGPVGAAQLTSFKYIVRGHGNTRP